MSDRIEKDWKDLDFDKVDMDSGNWSWGRGGHPLSDYQYSISHVSDKLVETRYKMPLCINQMLKSNYGYGKQDIVNNLRKILQINH